MGVFVGLGTKINLTQLIPEQNLIIELTFIFALILPLSSLIGLIVGGYVIAPLILYIHKKIYGSKRFYGILHVKKKERVRILSKGFFPVLMSINLASLLLTPTFIELILSSEIIFRSEDISKLPMLTQILAESVALMITFGLATTFFSSVWFLRDAGIIYSNKEKIENSEEFVEVKSIGDWFNTFLKSYAGIGALITYVIVVYNFVSNFLTDTGAITNILNVPILILWIGMPFYLAISLIPTLILNEILETKRVNYIKRIAEKLGIKETAIISFEFKKK
ncbi:MAG: hypothetical protein ACFFA6_06965 [Promethearchaeota archaeon]